MPDIVKSELGRLRESAVIAEKILSRWLAHQYDNQAQYVMLRAARDALRASLKE